MHSDNSCLRHRHSRPWERRRPARPAGAACAGEAAETAALPGRAPSPGLKFTRRLLRRGVLLLPLLELAPGAQLVQKPRVHEVLRVRVLRARVLALGKLV